MSRNDAPRRKDNAPNDRRGPPGPRGPRPEGRPPGGGGGGGGGGRGRDEGPGFGRKAGRDGRVVDFEYVVMTPRGSVAAEIRESWLPLNWVPMETPRLLTPGIFIRRGGGLARVASDLRTEPLTAWLVWDDPEMQVPAGPRLLKVGCHLGLLVPGPKDGPPFLPIHAVWRPSAADHESGLLAPSLDHLGCQRVQVTLDIDRGELVATSVSLVEGGDPDAALVATLRWLAEHPGDDGPAAALARLLLVDSGHGLQRLGLLLAHRSDAEKRDALEGILPLLAPAIAPVLSALWQLDRPAASDARSREERFVALVEACIEATGRDAAAGSPASVALLFTWVIGLFGFRPDRDGMQPARALWAATHVARAVGRHAEAVSNGDLALPVIPLDRTWSSALIREAAGARGPDPTPFEAAARALALAEWGPELGRPRLDVLEPFGMLFRGLRGYPVAARTLLGRYAGVLTGWSLRGAELSGGRLDPALLDAVVIADVPDPTVARALGRALGRLGQRGAPLAVAIGRGGHPIAQAIADSGGYGTDVLVERLRDAVVDRRYTARRLHVAVALLEQLAATVESGQPLPETAIPLPEPPTGAAMAGQFMYWRAFCRANVGALGPVQRQFVASGLAALPSLSGRYALELVALLRSLARNDASSRPAIAAGVEALRGTLRAALEAGAPGDAERVSGVLTVLADVDVEAFLDAFAEVVRRDDWVRWDLHRVLDSARRSGALDALVAHDAFARLHRLAADDASPAGAAVRGEWLRTALERARRRSEIRWFTDARTMHGLLAAPRLVDFFAQRGPRAVEHPDDTLVELVEVALRACAEADVDRVVATLRRVTRWPAAEVARAVREAGRDAAVLRLALRDGEVGAPELASIAPLLAADGGRASTIALAGALLAGARRRCVDVPSEVLAAVHGAAARFVPNRYVLEAFALVLDGVRLAGLDPLDGRLRKLLDRAAAWGAETGHPALVRYLSWAVSTGAAGLVEAVGLDAAALLGAASSAAVDPALARAAAGGKSPAAKRLRREVTDAASLEGLAGVVARVAGLGAVPLESVAAAISSALAGLGTPAAGPAGPAADGDDGAGEPDDAPLDTTEEVDAEASAAAAQAPLAEGATGPGRPAKGDAPGAGVVREAYVARVREALAVAARVVDALGEAGAVEPERVVAELGASGARPWSLGEDVAAVLNGACAARGVEIIDDHRVLGSESFDAAFATLDLEDLRLALDALLGASAGAARGVRLERSRVWVALDPVAAGLATADEEAGGDESSDAPRSASDTAPETPEVAGEDQAEEPNPETADDGGDEAADGAADDPAADAVDDAADAEADEAAEPTPEGDAGADRPARGDRRRRRRGRGEGPAAPARGRSAVAAGARALEAALRGEPSPATGLLGGALHTELLRIATTRSPDLRLTVGNEGGHLVLGLSWRAPRARG